MEMGEYCKAYTAKDYRALEGWKENLENLLPETMEEGGQEVEVPRTELKDDDILYLQENLRCHRRHLQRREHHLREGDRVVEGAVPHEARLRNPGLRADRDRGRR